MIKDKITFAIRYDDPSPSSKHDVEERVVQELLARNVPATFAAVPFRKASSGNMIPYENEHAKHFLLGIEKGLFEIALHGYTHAKINKSIDCADSEFAGVPLEQQKAWITAGKAHLESMFGPIVRGFVPPFNSYDQETLHAIASSEFVYLSADRRPPPRSSIPVLPVTTKLFTLKEAIAEARRFRRSKPVVILVLHHYDFDRDEDDPPGKVYSYKAFGELLDWLIEQPDVELRNLQQIATSISPKTLRWHHHDKWLSLIPWRFKYLLPSRCFLTEAYRFPIPSN